MKKILLTTVCGPFGVNTDDCTEHVMPELFHAGCESNFYHTIEIDAIGW